MNIIKNNTKLSVVFLGLAFLLIPALKAQMPIFKDVSGTPLIQKFPFPDFFLTSGKYSVYEDSSGTFLIGARNKLIMFYGNEFISIPLKGQINVSSNQRSVFYSGFNSLGLIRLFKNSQPQLIPVIDEKLGNSSNIGQIGKVFVSSGYMVFCNEKQLFVFDGTSINVVDSSAFGLQLFNVNDSLYVQKFETGLFKFDNGSLKNLVYGNSFANKTIEGIFAFGKQILVKCTDSPSFYSLDNKGVKKLRFGFEEYLDKAGFSDAKLLPGSRIAISSKSAGLLVYNFIKNTIQNIGVDEGLLANTVKNLYCDKAGNLWVLHDNGISRIELNIPASTYGQNSGISGAINDIVKFNNILYVATSNGLFKAVYKNISGASEFSKLHFTIVEEILCESNKLFIFNNKLYVTTPTAIYLVENNYTQIVYKGEINDIIQNPVKKTEFIIANEKSLLLIEINGAQHSVVSKSSFQYNCPIELLPENDTTIWVRSAENNLYTLKLTDSKLLDNVKEIYFESLNGKPVAANFYLLPTAKGVRFCFPDSILRYNIISGKFERDELKDVKQLQGLPWLVEIMTDKAANKWLHVSSSLQNLRGVLLYKTSAKGVFEKPVFFNTGSTSNPIFVDSDYVWIGGVNKLIQFNNKRPFFSYRNFSAIIKRIIIGKDSILRVGLDDPEISYKYNTIRFEVSSTCFEGEPNVLYKYNLKGLNDEWTNWTRRSSLIYHNLSPGQYSFKVKVLNVDGSVSAVTDISFYILKPFYLTYWAYAFYFLFFVFFIFVLLRWRMWLFLRGKEKLERIVLERTDEILKEKEKSEILIANMLPKGTADELKSTGKATSQKFAMATVLFSDIQGFTKIAEQMNPDLLIDELDAFFFHFDMVVEKYNIEKIKTIGDAYMCAGGIPNKNITNPVEVVLAALEMQEYMHELKTKNADIWDLRIGIHTGAVIAGVVGHKKFSYDIWGDTVNTASRMESSGEPGKVNISGQTFELVKDFFVCEHRGKMPVKYKGEIDMYFVQGIRPELCTDKHNEPNKKFLILLQLLRIQDVEDAVMEKLEKELPSNLHFHNQIRIKEFYNLVELFGRAEGLNEEENLLVRTAALLHDVGYISDYDDHETKSIIIAREMLPDFSYNVNQIEQIVELIESTKRTRKPKNKLEEILLDADMNYLSRADFVTLNENLFLELHEKGKVISKDEWTKMQVVLLSNHKYYTKVANLLRDVSSEQQTENLLEFSRKNNLS